MLPPVSLPSAASRRPAATAAPLPLEDPPGTALSTCGFAVGPNAQVSPVVKYANSSIFVVAVTAAPASRSRSTTVA